MPKAMISDPAGQAQDGKPRPGSLAEALAGVDFARVHAFARSAADVPDDQDARLVVLPAEHVYTKDGTSPAEVAAKTLLESRGNSPRLFRNSLVFLAADKARMQDPAILRERAKVQLVADEELERLYPKRVAVVEVTLSDGTRLTERVEAVRGTAQNPMPREEIIEKCQELIAPFLGPAKCKRLIDDVFSLERLADVRGLRPSLQRTA